MKAKEWIKILLWSFIPPPYDKTSRRVRTDRVAGVVGGQGTVRRTRDVGAEEVHRPVGVDEVDATRMRAAEAPGVTAEVKRVAAGLAVGPPAVEVEGGGGPAVVGVAPRGVD